MKSERENQISYINAHIYIIYKDGTDESHREHTYGHGWWRWKGEGGTNAENSMETLIYLPYVK